ncbi:MAG TPA: PhoPQ-activated pathogenicity-related family protein [Tepidisphaeraceae bacterium]|nr:PhoPQ-activated pathogenicity-related family protein [Tepidisphaeraceae bacterium]
MARHLPRARLIVLILGSLVVGRSLSAEQTALDRYVAAPDPSYSFHEVGLHDDGDSKTHVLVMTSQTFLTSKEVDRPVWKHWLTITIPDEVKSSTGLLFITGGSNDRPAPATADRNLIAAAQRTHSVVAELRDVPNEPLVFADDGKKRTEDAIIAYTWDKFLKTGDEKWPLRLPMTKAAVRAMDTVTTFCKSLGAQVNVDRFVVAGASKRGWTTWTTAAVDKRVIAIVPIVIDTLNLEKQSGRQPKTYGFYSSALKDYTDMGLPKWKGTPQFKALAAIEDPYSYRDRYTMPKLLINSTGDQYFLPDSSQFYFDDLPGVKYLRYVPNTDHSLAGSDAAESLMSFYGSIVGQRKLPRFTWTLEKDGAIRVQAQDRPRAVKLWQATDPNARDFRLQVLGPKWTSTPLVEQGDGVYLGRVDAPSKGWTAFMVELTFPNPGLPALKFTTQVRIVPDTLPFPQKQDAPTGAPAR